MDHPPTESVRSWIDEVRDAVEASLGRLPSVFARSRDALLSCSSAAVHLDEHDLDATYAAIREDVGPQAFLAMVHLDLCRCAQPNIEDWRAFLISNPSERDLFGDYCAFVKAFSGADYSDLLRRSPAGAG